jgi:hypothetical protein
MFFSLLGFMAENVCKRLHYIGKIEKLSFVTVFFNLIHDRYFIAIAFIAFTLHEIKQSCTVFFWTPGRFIWYQ